MLPARFRFPSRGSVTAPAAARGRAEGPMVQVPPPANPQRPRSSIEAGQFAPGAKPIQNLIGTGVRELFNSMLDAGTAVRLADTSARPRYFGTVLPTPQTWQMPSELNSADSVRASLINAGNAPEAMNKTTATGSDSTAPRIAASLPTRGR